DEPVVGYAPGRAHGGRRVIGVSARSVARVQVGTHRVVPGHRQPSDELLGLAVVPRHVVDPHHATARPGREGHPATALDLAAAVTADADRFRSNRVCTDRSHLCFLLDLGYRDHLPRYVRNLDMPTAQVELVRRSATAA